MITLGTWRQRAALMVLTLGMVGGAIGPTQGSDWQGRVKLDDAAKAFDDAALRIDTSPAIELARWTTPIYLSINENLGGIAAEVEAAVRANAAVARVQVTRVPWGDSRANFLVRSSGNDVGRPPCRSSVDWNDIGQMVRADVYVNLNNPGRVTRCINHEVLHGFGFRGHPHGSYSVLSYKYSSQAQLTDIDHLMLETLYDARLRPGTKLAAASSAACTILAEKVRASKEETAALCTDRATAPRRGLVAFSGSRPIEQAQQHPPSLQPGYRDGGM